MSKLGTDEHFILVNMLKEMRINAGLRQVDLAEKLKVPQSMVSKYEVGERRIDLLELRDICEALDVSLPGFIQELEQRIEQKKHEAYKPVPKKT